MKETIRFATVRISDVQSRPPTTKYFTELDSHADTCVAGKNCLVTEVYDKTVSVSGYDPNLGTKKAMQIVSAAVAYDDPASGETLILRIHQAVHIPTMTNNLLCPMQMRLNDVEVNDCPKFVHDNPTDKTHTITVKGDNDTLVIPLSLKGVTSYFPTRIPTAAENETCQSYNLTFPEPEWDPLSDTFALQEEAQVDSKGRVREPGDRPQYFISAVDSRTPVLDQYQSQCAAVLMEIEPTLDGRTFASML